MFVSEGTGAAIHVFSDDHCPAHVHTPPPRRGLECTREVLVRQRRGGADQHRACQEHSATTRHKPTLERYSEAPTRLSTELVDGTENHLLANQWAVVPERGRIELVSETAPNAKQISEAQCAPESESLHVAFRDGTTAQVKHDHEVTPDQ